MLECERQDTRKAMAYDLIQILKEKPGKIYSAEEIEKILEAYITGSNQ